MDHDLIQQVRNLLHTVDWDTNASDSEIMQAIDWVALRAAFESATETSDLEPNNPHEFAEAVDTKYKVIAFVGVPCEPSEVYPMTLKDAESEVESLSLMQPENRYEIEAIEGGE